jgi:isopenicillin N synthase-like dioxygenase
VPATVPVIDLTPWFDGGSQDRAGVARQVDEALRSSGFLLIPGHRVPGEVQAQTRAAAREFFALPAAAPGGAQLHRPDARAIG